MPGTLGEVTGHRGQKVNVVVPERRLGGVAVKRQHAPCRIRLAPQSDQELLIRAVGLDELPPARAAARIPVRRFVDADRSVRGPGDVSHLYRVVVVVFVGQEVAVDLSR